MNGKMILEYALKEEEIHFPSTCSFVNFKLSLKFALSITSMLFTTFHCVALKLQDVLR